MSGWAVGLDYVQALVWPGVIVFVALRFHHQFGRLLDRLTKVKTPAGTVEFGEKARALAADARVAQVEQANTTTKLSEASPEVRTEPKGEPAVAANERGSVPAAPEGSVLLTPAALGAWTASEFEVFRDAATRDPGSAVMGAWRRIEQFAHVVLRDHDINQPWTRPSAMQNQLRELGLGPHFLKVADELRQLRNKVAHGQFDISAAAALDYIDAAERLADALVMLLQRK